MTACLQKNPKFDKKKKILTVRITELYAFVLHDAGRKESLVRGLKSIFETRAAK